MNTHHNLTGRKFLIFLCTGNYYRSRFAEIFFNHYRQAYGCDWQAASRGIRPPNPGNIGPISLKAKARLEAQGIPVDTSRWPKRVTQEEMASADLVIALDEPEHRPMINEHFPEWGKQTQYWKIPDVAFMHPEQAMTHIENNVRRLLKQLTSQSNEAHAAALMQTHIPMTE